MKARRDAPQNWLMKSPCSLTLGQNTDKVRGQRRLTFRAEPEYRCLWWACSSPLGPGSLSQEVTLPMCCQVCSDHCKGTALPPPWWQLADPVTITQSLSDLTLSLSSMGVASSICFLPLCHSKRVCDRGKDRLDELLSADKLTHVCVSVGPL